MIPVSDHADPRLSPFANLKDRQLAEGSVGPANRPPLFLAEGELVVRQLLASPLRTHAVLCTPTRFDAMRDVLEHAAAPVYVVSQHVMDRVVGFNIHRGILAAGVRPAPPDLDQLLASASTLVVLENLANHDNVGGLFRSAAALGDRTAVLLSPGSCDPLYRKSIRVSIGTALTTPWAWLDPWPTALARLRTAGFTTIALTPDPTAPALADLPAIAKPALLLGAEGPGLSPDAFAHADIRARIPINAAVDSLNVTVAGSIALAQLARVSRPSPVDECRMPNPACPSPLFRVVLHQPEIPNNTGNIGRTCVATGCGLDLVHPLAFDTSEKACRRAGLDYWPRLHLHEHADWPAYLAATPNARRWFLHTSAPRSVFDTDFQPGDHLIFGCETKGLPQDILTTHADRVVALPMLQGERSLNLATAVCAVVYEAVRQQLATGRITSTDAAGRHLLNIAPPTATADWSHRE